MFDSVACAPSSTSPLLRQEITKAPISAPITVPDPPINDVPPMTDRNVRLAAAHAIDKQAIVDRLLRGYGVPLNTLHTPEYSAFNAAIKVAYDPDLAMKLLAASGYSPDNPVKFPIQTTRGFKPKDYEMIQAIVGMWRKVGIDATIEVYEIAKHYKLRAADHMHGLSARLELIRKTAR